MKYFTLILYSLFFYPFCLMAQDDNVLDKKINLEIKDETLPNALTKISQEAGFDFAYASNLISKDKATNLIAVDISVRNALEQLLDDESITYKMVGDQLIIYRPKSARSMVGQNTLEGYVYDGKTGKPLVGASIYDQYLGISTKTDQKGKFYLQIPNPSYKLELYCQHPTYQSKELKVKLNKNKTINIQLHPYAQEFLIEPVNIEVELEEDEHGDPIPAPMIEVENLPKPTPLLKEPSAIKAMSFLLANQSTIDSTSLDSASFLQTKMFQVGFIPPANSNFKNSGKSINRISMNVLIGYSAGLEGLEIGGLLNMERFNAKGVQFAGFGNIVAGKMSGFQFAGFNNTTLLKVDGFQIAGFNNFAGLNMKGTQISGFNNIVRGELDGFQLAGFNNIATKGGFGLQLAGVANTCTDSLRGTQIAGIVNTTSGNMKGAQIAGLANYVKNIEGVQISGFLNIAKEVDGVQIGFINFADSVRNGVSIGFLSFVKNGYRALEVSMDYTGFANVAFKTGIPKFYNIISTGIATNTLSNKDLTYYGGYGFGTLHELGDKFSANIDLSFNYLHETGTEYKYLNILNKIEVQLAYDLGEKTQVFVGATVNQQFSAVKNELGELSNSSISKSPLSEKIESNTYKTLWLGGKVGLRF